MENNTSESNKVSSSDLMDSLNWRSAIKQFDASKKVSDSDLNSLIQAANLAPSSGGLQPFQLVVISNQELKAKLHPLSYGQAQVADSSHLFVFAVKSSFGQELVDDYVQRMSELRKLDLDSLSGLSQSLSGFITTLPESEKLPWAARQAYISLGVVISTAAAMRIDTCPMEGFDRQQYTEILDLESKGLVPMAILAVGYRGDGDPFANMAKVRKKESDFVLRFD